VSATSLSDIQVASAQPSNIPKPDLMIGTRVILAGERISVGYSYPIGEMSYATLRSVCDSARRPVGVKRRGSLYR
jgi:hypothetical protein